MSTSNPFSNITVDGRPMADVQAEEASSEMHAALSEATPRISRRSAGSKHKTFTNGISRNIKLPDPEPDFTRYVIMRGVMYLRVAKEPFDASGESDFGALEYDPDTDKIKCHVAGCGQWFVTYGGHKSGNSVPHPSAKQYKKAHGLRASTALCGLRFKLAMRAELQSRKQFGKPLVGRPFTKGQAMVPRTDVRSDMERFNAEDNCRAQIKLRVTDLALELGRSPTMNEVRALGIKSSAIDYLFGSFNKALSMFGLESRRGPLKGQTRPRKAIFTKHDLLERLLSFHKIHGRWPKAADINPSGFLPSLATYSKNFGGLMDAVAKARQRWNRTDYAFSLPQAIEAESSLQYNGGAA